MNGIISFHILINHLHIFFYWVSQMAVVKNPPANARATGDVDSIPELGRSPRVRNSNPLQYSCRIILCTEEPGGLQSMGSQKVGHE